MASENGEVSEEDYQQLQELLVRTQEQLLRAHEQLLQLQMANLQTGDPDNETNGWAGQHGGGSRAIESPLGRGWSVQTPAGGSGGSSKGGPVASPPGWSDSPLASPSPGFSPSILRKSATPTGDVVRILERQEELRLKLQLLEKKQELEEQLRQKQYMLRASQKKQSHPDNGQLRPSVKSQTRFRENGDRDDRPLWSQNAAFAASTGSVMRGMNQAAMRGSTSSISGSRTPRALSRGRAEVRDTSPVREREGEQRKSRIRFSTESSMLSPGGDGRPAWRQSAAFAASTGSVMRGMNQAAMRERREGDF